MSPRGVAASHRISAVTPLASAELHLPGPGSGSGCLSSPHPPRTACPASSCYTVKSLCAASVLCRVGCKPSSKSLSLSRCTRVPPGLTLTTQSWPSSDRMGSQDSVRLWGGVPAMCRLPAEGSVFGVWVGALMHLSPACVACPKRAIPMASDVDFHHTS